MSSESSSSKISFHPITAFKSFPWEMVAAFAIGAIVMYMWGKVHFDVSVERFENKNILVTKAGALDNQFGQCMSEAGRDVGLYGGCGAAEPFAAKKKTNFSAGPIVSSRDELKKRLVEARSGFLNNRGAGPEVQMSVEDAEYWANEVANPGNAGGSIAQAAVVPPQAVAAASNFAAGRPTNDDLLMLQSVA